MSITGELGGPPLKAGPGLGDIVQGLFAAVGTLAAVHHARATGEGQHVDVAMYDAVLAVCERIVHQHSYAGDIPGPMGNKHPLLAPFETVATSDGWVTIAAPDDASWRALRAVVPGLDDPEFETNTGRVARSADIRAVLTTWAAMRTCAQVTGDLGAVPVATVQDVAAIAADPHVTVREMLVPLEHPGLADPRAVAGCPIKMSRTPPEVRQRAPLLGEHGQPAWKALPGRVNDELS